MYDIMYIMMDTLGQTHRTCNTKSEPYIKYGPWVITMYKHRSTEDGICSHGIKRCLLLRQKAMTNLDSIFKSRDITLLTKVCIVTGGLVTKSCPTLSSMWTVAHQALLSLGFSRQEYWSGLSVPPPEHLPDPGIKPRSSVLQADSFTH